MTGQAAFEPTWASLDRHAVPDWFRDAKFGIFLHWGVHSATEHHAWYGRKMYRQHADDDPEGAECYDFHVRHHGHPSEFGFKDFLRCGPASAGIRMVWSTFCLGRGALHHARRALPRQLRQPVPAVELGELRTAQGRAWRVAAPLHRAGGPTRTSDHASRAWQWMAPAHLADTTGPVIPRSPAHLRRRGTPS